MSRFPHWFCFEAAEPEAVAAGARPGARQVHFLRHGESLHQQRAALAAVEGRTCRCDRSPTPEERAACPYLAPDLVDPPLTDLGRRQVAGTAVALGADLVLAGAAVRSLETAWLATRAPAQPATGPRIVALEELRSRASAHVHTRRVSRSELAARFPAVDFRHVRTERDPIFTGETEGRDALDRRAAAFLEVLVAEPARIVAVVTHFTIFLTLFQSADETLVVGRNPERPASGPPLFDCSRSAEPERLRRFFEPGEIRSLVIVPAP